jgi:hypothetical protein
VLFCGSNSAVFTEVSSLGATSSVTFSSSGVLLSSILSSGA